MKKDSNRKISLRAYGRIIRHTGLGKNAPGSCPASCTQCEYYRPYWKYRTCMLAECIYGKKHKIFRRKPRRTNRFSCKGAEISC